jgi:hypothetical protein
MQRSIGEPIAVSDLRAPEFVGVRVGRIVRLTVEGQALVDFPGNPLGAIAARSVVSAASSSGNHCELNVPVLLVFENGDPTLPVIVGFVCDSIRASPPEQSMILDTARFPDIVVDGKTVVFEASAEIILRCGKSSVTLRNDGRIVIKGSEIVSRSSGVQKIKGASVRLN